MFLKLLISSVILVGFIMLALSVKLLFDKNAEFSAHSCALKEGDPDGEGACSMCKMKPDKNMVEMKGNHQMMGNEDDEKELIHNH